jgi:riboflavin kinase / FMN adenylyltransferase
VHVRGHSAAPRDGAAVVAIGNFDGVHVGHRALVRHARELAAPHTARAVALTFDPHPSALLSPRGGPTRLTSLARRVELLEDAGADVVVVEPFTHELAQQSPEAFIDDIVIGALGARAIVVGYDFAYGASRAGNTASLRAHGERVGVEVEIVAPVDVGGEVVSSTSVRTHLAAGELPAATRLLGRRWDIDGVVARGAQRGRELGIPTANLALDIEPAVRPGIYAVTFATEPYDRPLPAVASLGTNPTFVECGALVLEVHVLDWSGDVYGQRARVTFVARLRDEAKFESVDALVAQIHADIADARQALEP